MRLQRDTGREEERPTEGDGHSRKGYDSDDSGGPRATQLSWKRSFYHTVTLCVSVQMEVEDAKRDVGVASESGGPPWGSVRKARKARIVWVGGCSTIPPNSAAP